MAKSILRDVDSVTRELLAPAGPASVLIFVSSDCPISNGYAPELQSAVAGDTGDALANDRQSIFGQVDQHWP